MFVQKLLLILNKKCYNYLNIIINKVGVYMSHLVSYRKIEDNIRRTAEKGLISLLNQRQLEDLAF